MEHNVTTEMIFQSESCGFHERQWNGLRMLWSPFRIPKKFSRTTKSRNMRTVLKPVALDNGRRQQSPFPSPKDQYTMFSFFVCCCFFLACCTFVIQSSNKRFYRPISWISLYMWRGDFPLVVLISGHLSEKWLFCVDTFVALSVLLVFPKWLELLLSFPRHTTWFAARPDFGLLFNVAGNLCPSD